MICCKADNSDFLIQSTSNKYIYLMVYVDDIVIVGDDHKGIETLKQHLFQNFQTKDIGPLRYFLEIEVAQSKSSIVISSRKCALDISKEINLTNCKTNRHSYGSKCKVPS